MSKTFCVTSPVDGKTYVERPYHTEPQIQETLLSARSAQKKWRLVPLSERQSICTRFVAAWDEMKEDVAQEISWQMGRPVRYTPNEVNGMKARAEYMIGIAEESLADIEPKKIDGFERFIRHDPVGVVFVIAPWNYPLLTAVNSIVPAILAGNSVILKHSSQTPLCAERFQQAFDKAGLPPGVFQHLHITDEEADRIIESSDVDFVAFTGSVRAGHIVQSAASKRFIALGLELGGKDPAYVRKDCDLSYTIEQLVDGSFFNSGQSCCGIERIYVHAAVYDEFVRGFIALTNQYILGDPSDPATTLGPLVKASAADFVRTQIADAVAKGATANIDETRFPLSKKGTPYLAPQVLTNVDHTMRVMMEESFGPVIGIMMVQTDEEAIRLMNDSDYGLTASLWTSDLAAAHEIGLKVEAGTLFMNRCDYLDPGLAWTGIKDSGRGATLSKLGFAQLTRPKSYHLKLQTR